MFLRLIVFVLLLSTAALSRHMPRYQDLDEEDQTLFRAAYDTPSYNQNEYEEDLPLGKLDLVKDGMWAVKAKIKELKAFDKALAANLLSTRLKVKELLKEHLGPIKKHHHVETEKPSYGYQAPSYQYQAPQYPQYEPQYAAPQYSHDPYYGH